MVSVVMQYLSHGDKEKITLAPEPTTLFLSVASEKSTIAMPSLLPSNCDTAVKLCCDSAETQCGFLSPAYNIHGLFVCLFVCLLRCAL